MVKEDKESRPIAILPVAEKTVGFFVADAVAPEDEIEAEMKTTAKEAYELAASKQEMMTESDIRKAACKGETSVHAPQIKDNQKLIDALIAHGYVVEVQECLISWGRVTTDAMDDEIPKRCPRCDDDLEEGQWVRCTDHGGCVLCSWTGVLDDDSIVTPCSCLEGLR